MSIRPHSVQRALAARLAVALLLLLPPTAASAQVIEGGQVVDDSTHAPVAHVVVSLHTLTDGVWRVVDSARTDLRGLFQFAPAGPGIYRVGVLGTADPQFIGAADTLAADSMNTRSFAIPMLRLLQGRVYFEFQVGRSARAADSRRVPTYPPELRAERMHGEVDAQFVVNPDGTVESKTIRWLRSSDARFAAAVREYLLSARYIPATIDGHAVRQVVQQAFVFDVR